MRRILGTLISLLASSSASAAVVYTWDTVGTPYADTTFTGSFSVTDDAWRAGGFSHVYTPICNPALVNCGAANWSDPGSPNLSLAFSGHNSTTGYTQGFGDYFASYPGLTSMYWAAPNPIPTQFALSLDLLAGGSIDLNDGLNALIMSSSGDGLWTISYFDSDFGSSPCPSPSGYGNTRCAGVTGRWMVDEATIPVSLPGTLSLASLALAAAAGATFRRSQLR